MLKVFVFFQPVIFSSSVENAVTLTDANNFPHPCRYGTTAVEQAITYSSTLPLQQLGWVPPVDPHKISAEIVTLLFLSLREKTGISLMRLYILLCGRLPVV